MKLPVNVPYYSRKMLLGASLLLLFSAIPQGALALNEYGVDNVTVDADGKDATEARSKALVIGERDAFRQLIERLNPSGAPQVIAQTPPTQIGPMVRGYTVMEEKMTNTHYHAILNYSFDPQQIHALVPSAAIAAAATAQPTSPVAPLPESAAEVHVKTPPPAEAERALKAVLVLPIYNENNTLSLWQDDNRWRSVWYEAALESGGGLIVVPLGDINDRVDVDDTNVNQATTDSLKRLYDRYGVGQIVVVSAIYNKKADPKPALEVTLKKLLPGGNSETSKYSYTIRSTENLDALLLRSSNEIARLLFKQQTIDPNKVAADHPKDITARVNTTDIKEWQALRQKLLQRTNIIDIKFLSISYYETVMTITYKGTTDMLGKTLVASGLRVLQDGDALVLSLQ